MSVLVWILIRLSLKVKKKRLNRNINRDSCHYYLYSAMQTNLESRNDVKIENIAWIVIQRVKDKNYRIENIRSRKDYQQLEGCSVSNNSISSGNSEIQVLIFSSHVKSWMPLCMLISPKLGYRNRRIRELRNFAG